jgi:hypothetical protein
LKVQSESKSDRPTASREIRDCDDTGTYIAIFDAAVLALQRRKDAVQRELKTPGISAQRERLRTLLKELECISRALRGCTNFQEETLTSGEHISLIVDQVMQQWIADRNAAGATQ